MDPNAGFIKLLPVDIWRLVVAFTECPFTFTDANRLDISVVLPFYQSLLEDYDTCRIGGFPMPSTINYFALERGYPVNNARILRNAPFFSLTPRNLEHLWNSAYFQRGQELFYSSAVTDPFSGSLIQAISPLESVLKAHPILYRMDLAALGIDEWLIRIFRPSFHFRILVNVYTEANCKALLHGLTIQYTDRISSETTREAMDGRRKVVEHTLTGSIRSSKRLSRRLSPYSLWLRIEYKKEIILKEIRVWMEMPDEEAIEAAIEEVRARRESTPEEESDDVDVEAVE